MKLSEAVALAHECGLTTYGEAFANVDIHICNLFAYDAINDEMQELAAEYQAAGVTNDQPLPPPKGYITCDTGSKTTKGESIWTCDGNGHINFGASEQEAIRNWMLHDFLRGK